MNQQFAVDIKKNSGELYIYNNSNNNNNCYYYYGHCGKLRFQNINKKQSQWLKMTFNRDKVNKCRDIIIAIIIWRGVALWFKCITRQKMLLFWRHSERLILDQFLDKKRQKRFVCVILTVIFTVYNSRLPFDFQPCFSVENTVICLKKNMKMNYICVW